MWNNLPSSRLTPVQLTFVEMSWKKCIAAMKWVPVLVIVCILAWSYYAYVFELCFGTALIFNPIERCIYLVLYHIFFVMFFWAYWQTIVHRPEPIPEKFHLPPLVREKLLKAENDEMRRRAINEFASTLPIFNLTQLGGARYCDKCHLVKPDRSHHCSVCGRCILKMDHHCPWVNNCVSYNNYKFFLLFLFYALLYCVYVCTTVLPYFILCWRGGVVGSSRFHIVFLFFVAVMFGISLMSLFTYHCYLVVMNRTTLEAFRPPIFPSGPERNAFNLGTCKNIEQVFGTKKIMWMCPLMTSLGDGIVYPTNFQAQTIDYNSMGTTSSDISSSDVLSSPSVPSNYKFRRTKVGAAPAGTSWEFVPISTVLDP